MPVTLVEPARVRVRENYDPASRIRLVKFLRDDFMSTRATNGADPSKAFFFSKMTNAILEHQWKGQSIFDPTAPGPDREFDVGSLTDRTIGNCLKRELADVNSIHPATLRLIDAYLQVSQAHMRAGPAGPSFLDNLGTHTAFQYFPRRPSTPSQPLASIEGVYEATSSDTFIPGSSDSQYLAISFRAVEGKASYLLCHVLTLTRGLECFRLTGHHKADWNDDLFFGIAVLTGDGITCHLRSLNAAMPLYIFIKQPQGDTPRNGLRMAFAAHQSPGYLQEYQELPPTARPEILTYFDNFPWLI